MDAVKQPASPTSASSPDRWKVGGCHSHSTQFQPQPKRQRKPARQLRRLPRAARRDIRQPHRLDAAVAQAQHLGRTDALSAGAIQPPWSRLCRYLRASALSTRASLPPRSQALRPSQEKEKTEPPPSPNELAIQTKNRPSPSRPPKRRPRSRLSTFTRARATQQGRHRRDRRNPHRPGTMQLKNGTASVSVAGPRLRRPFRLLRQHRESNGSQKLVYRRG